LEAKPFDGVAFGLGVMLAISWAWARWRPHPTLFLVDALWFGALAVHIFFQIQAGRNSFLYLVVALGVLMAITGFQHFLNFRGCTIPRPKGW